MFKASETLAFLHLQIVNQTAFTVSEPSCQLILKNLYTPRTKRRTKNDVILMKISIIRI